ncbi:U6 snRNA-associated Sm-like protein LSm1 [Nematocida parisii]|uniref:Sm domain-containing protein n=1 Tax=Nematocida parisii (strain ERTm3) TaxID=935791 RepID=I3EE77_NEMP3|nr:uncharacterized protein NEPG_00128 [Nematocida parisii ERTm1]EIJ87524.1 hypothetical protein NEQG_02405 [Nematocida parisii ERTm3]KAI5130093.1 U6 snRNA-associated Sm-like protein LSm1 [Nematocida parisii]EIJ94606.1 hypothetical protein NEPG_00128 [Nematocida parisii ERTm1]KAI5130462.1 U6 snRNA-associated Sm-like protein LSm1 [Nematocida parisii]KAI5142791.1 U6 snRNA-associated Sm-like protein LSm1 [Nematocida parisii]|eukprot:XP_013057962.1 hypothetical protein NEPG_00128 [Nematocida parisii ERTm1]
MDSPSTDCKGIRLLEEYLDKDIFVVLRDNTYIKGILRSYDQYYNILLEDITQYVISNNEYLLTESESVLLRGENIILLGEGTFNEQPDITRSNPKFTDDLNYITL